jgi:hypothetical protein
MKSHRWIVLLAVGGLSLAACAPAPRATETCEECPPVGPTCDPEETTALDAPRERGWVLLQVANPESAAAYVWETMTDDDEEGNYYVIVRADAIEGPSGYNLMIPVDAAEGRLDDVVAMLVGDDQLQVSASTVLRVTSHEPSVPHRGFSFITPGEFNSDPLPELCPPGRHPQSPGANPWG